MTTWKFNGYTKVKSGSGRSAHYVERHYYICEKCKSEIGIPAGQTPPKKCPKCEPSD